MPNQKKKNLKFFLLLLALSLILPFYTYSATFDLPLIKGWNLVSLPLVPDNSDISSIFSPINTDLIEIWSFDALDSIDPWKHFTPTLTNFNDLKYSSPLNGYWINTNSSTYLTLTGSIPKDNFTLHLKEGWNLFSWPYLYETYIEYAMPDLQIGRDFDEIAMFDSKTKDYKFYFANPNADDFDKFSPGNAYYIHSTGDIDVTIYCVPQVKITSPIVGSRINTDYVNVKGTIDDPTSLVAVNGVSATILDNTFEADILLSVGTNLISAIAINQAGNSSEDTTVVISDENTPCLSINSYPKTFIQGSIVQVGLTWNGIPTDQNYKLRLQLENWQSSPNVCVYKDIENFTSSSSETIDLPIPENLKNTSNCRFVVAFISKATEWRNVFKLASTPNDVSIDGPKISIDSYPKLIYPEIPITLTLSWDKVPLDKGYILRVQLENYNTNPSITEYIDITNFDSREFREITLPISYNLKGVEGCNFAAAFMKPGTNFSSSNIIYRTPKDVELKAFLNPSFYVREGDKTNSRDINLVLYAEGAYEMLIADNPGMYNASWESFNMYKVYTIQGMDGYKRIYVKFRDKDHRESAVLSVSITLDTTPPIVTITSPANNAQMTSAPIAVTGTINDTTSTVYINGIPATNSANTYTVDGINLRHGLNTITSKAIDPFGNISTVEITVNSTTSSDYLLTKLTDDIYLDSANLPVAGTTINLKVKLEVDGAIAINEPIKFTVTEGGGSLSLNQVNTSAIGEAENTLTTGTNSNLVNTVEAYALNYPNQKITFTIYAKPGDSYQLVKVTDDSVKLTPGSSIFLAVKLSDSNGNIIQGKKIDFSIIEGNGTLSTDYANTDYFGLAQVNFVSSSLPQTLTKISATLSTNLAISTIFNITTSPNSIVTAEELFNRVDVNANKLQDQIIEVNVTSDDPSMPSNENFKVWLKGDLMKVQKLPDGQIQIRPQLQITSTGEAESTIISFDSATNIYTVKTKEKGQVEEMPYTLTYIDNSKGTIVKTEFFYNVGGLVTKFSTEMSDFIQATEAGNCWLYNTKKEKMFDQENNLICTTTTAITSRQINAGLTDLDFK